MLNITKNGIVTPGEKVAVIEEFNSGEGTYITESEVRSLQTGEVLPNLSERSINIKTLDRMNIIPQPRDIIIGVVETAQTNIVNMRIESINGKPSTAGFTGMLQILPNRSGRGKPKRGSICKTGDIVRALVFSNLNSIIHLSIDRPDLGVIKASCSLCGSKTVRFGDRFKCVNCGNVEERQLASEFGIKKIQ